MRKMADVEVDAVSVGVIEIVLFGNGTRLSPSLRSDVGFDPVGVFFAEPLDAFDSAQYGYSARCLPPTIAGHQKCAIGRRQSDFQSVFRTGELFFRSTRIARPFLCTGAGCILFYEREPLCWVRHCTHKSDRCQP